MRALALALADSTRSRSKWRIMPPHIPAHAGWGEDRTITGEAVTVPSLNITFPRHQKALSAMKMVRALESTHSTRPHVAAPTCEPGRHVYLRG